MNELIKVDFTGERPAVSARELHEFLEVKTAYKDWFPRMCEYGFTEGEDFCSFLSESTGGRPAQDAQLTIDMAKEICMLQRNEKGKQARQYFIKLEKDWNSPEKVMARRCTLRMRKSNCFQPRTPSSPYRIPSCSRKQRILTSSFPATCSPVSGKRPNSLKSKKRSSSGS